MILISGKSNFFVGKSNFLFLKKINFAKKKFRVPKCFFTKIKDEFFIIFEIDSNFVKKKEI